MPSLTRPAVVCAISLLITGCAAARRPYTEPTFTNPSTWSRDTVGGPSDTDRLGSWWVSFGDPVLSDLMQQIVAGNLDIKTALSRVREARAQIAISRSNRLPSVSTGLGGTASHTSTEARGGIAAQDSVQQVYSLDADASWEIDVFGERRAGVDSSLASADAAALDLQDVLTSALADAATQYVRLRALQERVQLAERNAQLQADTLEIATFRYQAGLTTELDVHQARTNLESTRAQIAGLQLELAQTAHALALLRGSEPTALDAMVAQIAPIPTPSASLAIGVPADALRRRPDVRAAERRLAAQAAQVNAARARLYPKFSLAGSIGLETLDLARLFVPGASFFRFSPSASWNVFDRRQLKQNVVIETERENQNALQYESTVLRALRDVEDALVSYALEQVRRDRLSAAVAAAQEAADLASQRYSAGLRDFRDVLDAQRSLVSLQDQLASSRSNVSTAVVRLYRAVGGGWSPLPPEP